MKRDKKERGGFNLLGTQIPGSSGYAGDLILPSGCLAHPSVQGVATWADNFSTSGLKTVWLILWAFSANEFRLGR